MGVVIKIIGSIGILAGLLVLLLTGAVISAATDSAPYANILVFLLGFSIIVPSIFIYGFGEIIELLKDIRNEVRKSNTQTGSLHSVRSVSYETTESGYEQPEKAESSTLWQDLSKRLKDNSLS